MRTSGVRSRMTYPPEDYQKDKWALSNLWSIGLTRFWTLLGRKNTEIGPTGPKDSFEIEELIDDIDRLIVKNKEGYFKTEKIQEEQRITIKYKTIELQGLDERFQRIRLREIARIKKRISQLDRILKIYNDNIDLHQLVSEQLEDQLAAGQIIISVDQIVELHSDHEELYEKHREMVMSAQTMINPIDYPEDDFLKDPEIRELAEECGLSVPNTL